MYKLVKPLLCAAETNSTEIKKERKRERNKKKTKIAKTFLSCLTGVKS